MIILYVRRVSFFFGFFLLPLSSVYHSLSARPSLSRYFMSLARTRETPRCISSIFKHGLSACGSGSIYKASGRLLSCLVPSWWSHRRKRGIRIVRGSVIKSIRCRRAAFYLYPPPSTFFSHSCSFSLFIFFVISLFFIRSPLFLSSLSLVCPYSIGCFLFIVQRYSLVFTYVITAGGCSLV